MKMNENIINILQNSALFNLSLGSKELFHTNFLCWLARTYPQEFGKQFAIFCKIKPINTKIDNIEREAKGIDLSFSYPNGQKIIIENKVKGLPCEEQLKKYSKVINNEQNCILLSLSKPYFFTSTFYWSNHSKWHYVSYWQLNQLLKAVYAKITDDYHKKIMLDYICFIDCLVQLEPLFCLKKGDKFDFHNEKKNDVLKAMRKLRLHDMYLKRKYEKLSIFIKDELCNRKKDIGEIEKIVVEHGMSSSKGFVDVRYEVKNNLFLGIQLQSTDYRLFITDNDNKTAKSYKNGYLKNFWGNSATFLGKEIYPKGNKKKFNKFGENFFYKSIKIDDETEGVDSVINSIINDVILIKSNVK